MLNSREASALIRETTGRDCTRQNFEKLCNPKKNGPLRDCVLQQGPLRVDGDLVLAEYLAKVAPNQINARQPRAKPKPPAIKPPVAPAPVPTPAAEAAPPAPVPAAAPTPTLEPMAAKAPQQPSVAPPPPAAPPARSEDIPDYNDSRARSEYEKANLLELDRKTKEGLLLPAGQVEKVWDTAVTTAKVKLLAVPTRLRQRIPHLSLEEIAIAEALIRECMEELVTSGN